MVNVNDFKSDLPEGDLLEAIFNKQKSLIEKYHGIEETNAGHPVPYGMDGLDYHDRAAQARFKDFAWRVTEEIAEATECLTPDGANEIHYLEELVDALHFFVELLIYSKFTPHFLAGACGVEAPPAELLRAIFDVSGGSMDYAVDFHHLQLESVQHEIKMCAYATVEGLGKAMNCLKNKPWKQSAMLTDEEAYRRNLASAFNHFIGLLAISGFTPESLTVMYLNKNAVNQFRIRSQY